MPVAIPLVAAAAGAAASYGAAAAAVAAGIAATTTSFVAVAIGAIAGVVATMAVNYLASAMLGTGAKSSTADTTSSNNRGQQIRAPIVAHRVIFGTIKASGAMVFIHCPPDKRVGFASAIMDGNPADYKAQQLIYIALVLTGHEVAAIRSITVDNTPIEDGKFAGLAHVDYALGMPDQVANPMLLGECDGAWTLAHRLRGRACLFGGFKYDQAAFSGVPNMAAIVDGALAYDPRTGATAHTSNPALLVAHYLTAGFGLRCSDDEIDWVSVTTAANICDEQVALRSGAAEARYACNGAFALDEAPSSVLDKLKQCMDGVVVFTGGKWLVFAGAHQAPTLDFGESDLRGPVVVQANRPARDTFNAARATYVRPDGDWQATDAPVRYDEAAIAAAGGQVYYQDFTFDFVTSGFQAQRLMQIALRRNRLGRTVQLQLNMRGLLIRPMDIVSFATERLLVDTYRVTAWKLVADGVDVTLEQERAEVYAWDPAIDEFDLGDVSQATLPTGVSLDAPEVTIETITTPLPSAPVSLTASDVPGAERYDGAWREITGAVWQSTDSDQQTSHATPEGLAAYRMRARASGQVSKWTVVDPPDKPRYLQTVGVTGGIGIGYDVQPVPHALQVFTGPEPDFEAAVLTPTRIDPSVGTMIDVAGPDQVYVWLRVVADTGAWSDATGPIATTPGAGGKGGEIGTPPTNPSSNGDTGA